MSLLKISVRSVPLELSSTENFLVALSEGECPPFNSGADLAELSGFGLHA